MELLKFHYSTYQYAAYIAPLIVLGISLIGLLVAVYAIILVCWPFKKGIERFADKEIPHSLMKDIEAADKKIPCWTCIFGGLKLVYGHQIDECEHHGHQNIYTICGRHVRPWLLVVLFMVVVFVCSCTVVTFWCQFLITESDRCNHHMDCFVRNETTKEFPEIPVSNCSDYDNVTSYVMRCYRFSFNYADALGDAGGVMILATVIMNIQAGLWIGASSQTGKKTWYLAVMGVALLNIVIEVGLIATPLVVQFVPLLQSRITNTDKNAVQFYTYWATFLCAFTISGPIFIVFSKRLRRQTMVDGIEQYVSVNSKNVRMSNSAVNTDSESNGELDFSDQHRRNDYGTV